MQDEKITDKALKRKIRFADFVILLCLFNCMCITWSQLYEFHRLNLPMPAENLAIIVAMWSSELLFVALRQVFGSDVVGRAKNYSQED